MKSLKIQKPDHTLALLVFGLVVFGLVMISSASSVLSYQRFGRDNVYLIRQLVALGVGVIVWIIFQSIDYRVYRKIAPFFLLATLSLLILVFVPGVGHSWRGTARWISIGGFAFQPSEIIKLTLILYLSAWFEREKKDVASFKKGFLPFSLLLGFLAILIIKQPDMGTLAVITGIAITLYFLAGAAFSHFCLGLAILGVLFGLMVKYAPYRMERVIAFLNPEHDPLGIAYHIRNALIAIGSGGLLGLGFGQSRQKHLFLPEAHTDSIFATIAEELGFLRTVLLIAAFGYLAYRGYKIAQRAPDKFGQLVAAGIVTWFTLQAFINIAGITGLLPFTGIPLPFVSYGGTSLVVSFAAVGILLNISKYALKSK